MRAGSLNPSGEIMKDELIWKELDFSSPERLSHAPLLQAICRLLGHVTNFKELARGFYFDVILTAHPCPACGGKMEMSGQGRCSCCCGLTVDPTIEFQRSACCDARLVRKTLHYTCSSCRKVIPSVFLFDERLFDKEYFREMMKASREKRQRKKEEIKRMLAASRSSDLSFAEYPGLDGIPGLEDSLNAFIGSVQKLSAADFTGTDLFRMHEYKEAILAYLKEYEVLFSSIPPICDNPRKDRARRFITLIYMEQQSEVELTQYGDDILVERYEAQDDE